MYIKYSIIKFFLTIINISRLFKVVIFNVNNLWSKCYISKIENYHSVGIKSNKICRIISKYL